MKLKAVYVWDEDLIKQCDRLPAVLGRASMVHNLISVYGLLKHVQVVRSASATYNDLKTFHSELYLDHLKKLTDIDDDYMPDSQDEEYGIGYDCPPVSGMFSLVSTIAGGSITAAKCLLLGIADVAINWCGGWHHAHRFGAEGFCYVNDIVLAIEKLKLKFPKILYIDLDVHHGNGVQDAYNLSRSVFTLSFHKHEAGFYPGTGSVDDIGSLTGKGYSCNFALKAGYSDSTMEYAFEKVFTMVYSRFMPDAIVVQCGADALAHDPHGGASLTSHSYCRCIKTVLHKQKPTLLLGGGGYNHMNVARMWTTLVAEVVGVELNENIPEHDEWPSYGPDFSLVITPTLTKDCNSKEYLDQCIISIENNLKYISTSAEEPLAKRKKTDDDNEINDSCMKNSLLDDSNIENNGIGKSKSEIKPAINADKTTVRVFQCSYTKQMSPIKQTKDIYDFED